MKTKRSTVTRLWVWIALSLPLLLFPAAARADCQGKWWDLSGTWELTQDNGITATFNLKHHKTKQYWGIELDGFDGPASFRATGANPNETPPGQDGEVHGFVTYNGHDFQLTASWSNGSVGNYLGTVDSEGNISGSTQDEKTGGSAGWHGDHQAKCVAAFPCENGLVWRESNDYDFVCVKPEAHYRQENGICRSGYVWRDTFDGDNVCVTPAQRDAAKAQKRRDELGVVQDRPGAGSISK